MLTGITTIAPGSAVPLHTHNCEESVVVLSGQGVAHIDGADHPVAPRDTSCIPAGIPHCFRNEAGDEPLVIFWTYASIDATRPIVATGVTTRIRSEEHTSELQSLMRISYAVFCLKKQQKHTLYLCT